MRGVISFVMGACVGVAGTYIFLNKRFNKMLIEEENRLKGLYEKKELKDELTDEDVFVYPEENGDEVTDEEKAVQARNKEDISDYARKMIHNEDYTRYFNKGKEAEKVKAYEYIAPGEIGEEEDYDICTLTYFADGILADENDEILDMEEYAGILGNFTTHFGEFADDEVCVRNDDQKTYYEVLMDYRNYADVVGE